MTELRDITPGDRFMLNGDRYKFKANRGDAIEVVRLVADQVQTEPGVFAEREHGVEVMSLSPDVVVEQLPSEMETRHLPETTASPPLDRDYLRAAFEQAVQSLRKKRQKSSKLTAVDSRISLQRKWHHIYPDASIPEEFAILLKLVPSGLERKDRLSFVNGSLQEAKYCYLNCINTSWTKRDLHQKLFAEGVMHALDSFDENTKARLEKVIAFLSD